jgi:CHAT domain-containing protein
VVTAAGTENVIGPLWPIEDEMSMLFYRELAKNDVATALARASRAAIRDGWPILTWAGFQLFGTGRRIVT